MKVDGTLVGKRYSSCECAIDLSRANFFFELPQLWVKHVKKRDNNSWRTGEPRPLGLVVQEASVGRIDAPRKVGATSGAHPDGSPGRPATGALADNRATTLRYPTGHGPSVRVSLACRSGLLRAASRLPDRTKIPCRKTGTFPETAINQGRDLSRNRQQRRNCTVCFCLTLADKNWMLG